MRMSVLFSSIVLMIASISVGQDQPPPPPWRGPGAERIAQFKKIRLMETLKMNEETSIRFFIRYNKHNEEIQKIESNRNAYIDQLQELVRSNAADADIEKIINDINLIDEKLVEQRLKFLKELKEILTVKQIAEYITFERNFNQNLRELMREAAKDRWQRRKYD